MVGLIDNPGSSKTLCVLRLGNKNLLKIILLERENLNIDKQRVNHRQGNDSLFLSQRRGVTKKDKLGLSVCPNMPVTGSFIHASNHLAPG